jgi:hypothetical protein
MMRLPLSLLLAVPLAAQGTYRHPPSLSSTARLAADAVPVPPPPNYFMSAGGGDQTPGRGAGFGYWSVSRYVGQQNWLSAISEYSFIRGQVVTCPLAGLSHVVAGVGPVSFGLVGAGGACSGDKGGATGAASAQGFASFHIAGSWNIIATARKTFTPDGADAVRVTLGVGYAK